MPVEMNEETGDVDLLGFLKTRDGSTHLLVRFNLPGTSVMHPVLQIFGIRGIRTEDLGSFCGFYYHATADGLRDLGGDMNTEVISVEGFYWPPYASHAKVEVFYGIAEFKEGRYVEANEKFQKEYEELNR